VSLDLPDLWPSLFAYRLESSSEAGAPNAVWRYFPNSTVTGAFRTKRRLMAFVGFATSDGGRHEKTDHGGLLFMALARTIDRVRLFSSRRETEA
jgi:hypothetical protein